MLNCTKNHVNWFSLFKDINNLTYVIVLRQKLHSCIPRPYNRLNFSGPPSKIPGSPILPQSEGARTARVNYYMKKTSLISGSAVLPSSVEFISVQSHDQFTINYLRNSCQIRCRAAPYGAVRHVASFCDIRNAAIVAQCSRCTTEQPLEHRLPCTWSDLHVHKVRNDYSNNRFKYASCSYCRQARATRAASCPTRDTRSWTLSAINNRQQWSNELFTTLATSACHCR